MRKRWLSRGVLIGIVTLLLGGSSAMAAIPGHYTFTTQHGTTFALLSGPTHLIIPASGATDDTLTTLNTTRSGAFRLPFRLPAYGNTYGSVRVSSNGNLQFGVGSGGSAAFSNDPLPSAAFAGPTLMPFWDDLYFVPSDTSHFFTEGIYTRTSGSSPHRTFTISWQGHAYNNEAYLVLAQVVFHQGSQTIRYRYGTADNQGSFVPSETIGAQANGTWTQIAFDPPPPGLVTPGTQFTLTHH